jgi:predicted DNA-binding helix-hairpin-helix protein
VTTASTRRTADWLTRFYRFRAEELVTDRRDMLGLAIDPKLAWALEHREDFPMNVNCASREKLLRVPGFGVRSMNRILQARRHGSLRMADLARLRLLA